jgi:iron complex outermembrane recepter protein
MQSSKRELLCACSALWMASLCSPVCAQQAGSGTDSPVAPPSPAAAQEAGSNPAAASHVAEVVVTGSRTVPNGNAAPTPVTVVSSEQLELATPSNIANALEMLPQFSGTIRPSSYVSAQMPLATFLNLRDLGDLNNPRTLVLFDGRRVNPATSTGQVDVNAFPDLLVKRVDVVTGGASAAYGSDAVAGVVNYVLDRNFEGFLADVNGGLSTRGDDGSEKVAVAGGAKFLDGRLHVIGSVEYYHSAGILNDNGRSWAQKDCEPIANPAYATGGQSQYLMRCGVVGTDLAPGGVIANGPLKGTQFLGGGATAPYAYGTYVTPGSTMVGGDGMWIPRATLAEPLTTVTLFSHADYHATDNLTLYAEGSYSDDQGKIVGVPAFFSGGSDFKIMADNAFLPAATRAAMAGANLTSITVGRAALDWGRPVGESESRNARGTLGFDYDLRGWVISGYVDFGRTTIDQSTSGQLDKSRAYEAADAVVDPATNQIVCRSTLTNPQNGCVPLNIFGVGSASAAALAYIHGEAYDHSWSQQLASELSVRGSPFRTWAGPVKVAAGLDYRDMSAEAVADPVSSSLVTPAPGSLGMPASVVGALGGWQVNDQVSQPYASDNVKEVFAETYVPLADGVPGAYAADIDAAVRYADYSASGGVTSWKLGASYAPTPDIRFRATRSQDVRAPNLSELYQSPTAVAASISDPVTKSTAVVTTVTGGNPNLRPEIAQTSTVGFVLTPRVVNGLSIALDYYSIRLNGAIASLAAQSVVNQCAAGQLQYCQYVTRGSGGVIISVDTLQQNLGSIATSGLDLEGNYRVSLERLGAPGSLALRALLNYVDKFTTTDAFGNQTQLAGVDGGEVMAIPRFQSTVSLMYTSGRFTGYVQERFISAGAQDTNETLTFGAPYVSGTGPNSLDYNHVPAVFYTDATVRYAVTPAVEIYANVNNLFDRDPPLAPTRAGVPITTLETNGTLYDVVGRYISVGFRVRY